jgi:DNA-directed RNA polymerase specialized sigma24 family protein
LRRKQRRPHPPWLDPESDAFRRAIGVSLAEQTLDDSPNLEQALLSLPKVQAAVLLLHIRDKQSWEEIARRLDMSIEEVQHHLAQGLARLRLSCWEL